MKQTNTENRASELYALFTEYMNAYRAEWQRLDSAERVYRGEHWHELGEDDKNEPRPVTPVIQSTIESLKADLMDNLPEAIIVSDEPGEEKSAEAMTKLVAENHRLGRFEMEYSKLLHDLLVGGYMIIETGFDEDLACGTGAAFLRHVDTHCVMFDPLVADIQDSRAVFKFSPYPKEWFLERWPEHAALMQDDTSNSAWFSDSHLVKSQSDTILLIECWQREYDPNTRLHKVHMTKLAGGRVLADSRDTKKEGYFAHGEYPFIVTPLFTRKGTALGYGFVDMFETQQKYADKLDQIILKNALLASHNKLLITSASGFDADDLRDWSKDVHRGENLAGVTWFPTAPLPQYLISYGDKLRQDIKEESGSNDFSRGETYGGVTAASAIAALQEASTKRTRMICRALNGAFESAVRQELEVEREFALLPRYVGGEIISLKRLMKKGGNRRLPVEYTITVKAQRESRFSTAAHNELVFRMAQSGMITPDVGLKLLMFEGKAEAVAMMKNGSAGESGFSEA